MNCLLVNYFESSLMVVLSEVFLIEWVYLYTELRFYLGKSIMCIKTIIYNAVKCIFIIFAVVLFFQTDV